MNESEPTDDDTLKTEPACEPGAKIGWDQEPGPLPRLTEDDIRDTVLALVRGELYLCNSMLENDPSTLQLVFMPIALGCLKSFTKEAIQDIAMIYARMSDRMGNRYINGHPMFHTCAFVHKDDWKVIAERYNAIQRTLKTVAEGGG